MQGAFFLFHRPGWAAAALACLLLFPHALWATESNPEPDRYLFDSASQVYRVFGEVRTRAQPPVPPMRSLASISPILRDSPASSDFLDSLASKIRSTIRTGVVSPSDIQLPEAASHDTQDSSKN